MKRLIAIPLLAVIVASSGCAAALIGGALGAGAYVAMDRRNVSQVLTDQKIELGLTDQIYHTDDVPPDVHVSVTSYNGLVLLTGEVPRVEVQQRVMDLARATANVRDVYNQVTIGPSLPLGARNRDSWLTSQVKAKLIAHRGVLTRVKVISNDGAVYLLGLSDQAEATDAYQVASKIEGVNKVIPVFEIGAPVEPKAPIVAPVAIRPIATPVTPVTKLPEKPAPATATEDGGDDIKMVPYLLQPPIKTPNDK